MRKPVKKTPSLPGFDSDLEPETPSAPVESFVDLVGKKPEEPATFAERVRPATDPILSSGEKGKARDIIAAIKTLQLVEREKRPATPQERDILARFPGFGPVALSIFPDPVTNRFKDESWRQIGEELRWLLTPQEYDSAKRTTFNAFYTSSTVIKAMYQGLKRLGVPDDATVLEPGAGPGRFLYLAPKDMRFIAVEMDSISGRIAKALHPGQDIRIEDFQDSRLPQLDAVIGNVPFADVKLEHRGQKFSLHDYFFAKSCDVLKPGGVMALITSHYTLDKNNAAIREYLASKGDFLGAIRLPSDAFKREGTSVVTDIVFMRKRSLDEPPNHVDPDWLQTEPKEIDGVKVPVNKYFIAYPEMVLGNWSRKDTLYGGEGFSITSNGDLAEQLQQAVERLPQQHIQNVFKTPIELKISAPQPIVFVPPPLERHITEGSFFIHDKRIHQLVSGESVPVVYGGGELWANGAMFGRRMGALIELRDKARRVLQSQNEGWPEENRQAVRRDLNRAYDSFVSAYGPINRTTFSETKDGTTIRRMPNIAKFREDPDAMLVMALEEYDEETGTAKKAPIMQRDVVGRTPPITSVTSAEEGLLVSLDHKGAVDLPYISKLYGKSEQTVISELGDLIYLDPETDCWETADAYLSGNVRAKLAAARKAGPEYVHNLHALEAVQPEDVLPGDIDANLGAPWIPASDIQAFAADLFQVMPGDVTIAHLAKDATWAVEGNWSAQQSVATTADYGTSRANGLWLLELALNMKSPIIYDPDPDDPDRRVQNPEATLAAKEKQKAIKEQFHQWVFADPDRTERLVRTYNDTYNCMRPRVFDGSHLDFPGMSQAVELRPHQRDAIWRVMSGGNTLLAHAVGAGKSWEIDASAMKLKQTGLAKKSLIAVPNHLLEQFAREFQQCYPNAKLLVAGKDDFTKERRKFLTAKIASGDWDAIIVTHSSFERIGMSQDFQARFLREQIAEYEQLICDRTRANQSKAHRNIMKALEKQKASREAKLKELLAQDKKDTGLVFDELGVDQVFIDEFQNYKNLEVATKMDRVAGIQTGGSERAFDLFMKARYLHEQHAGHGLVGASGTPISNSLVEMYTLQRYFDPEGLKARSIEHFDAWAATFGEVVESMEISPDGQTLKPRSRFSKFVNLPELQQMFRSFADVQTAEMLNLPRPTLEGGKPQIVSCPMSDEQSVIQQELVARYERIRNGGVDPREDNALAITTDGRKLALDARMLSATAPREAHSKLEAMLDLTADRWKLTSEKKSTQMIFCDMGVNPTAWGYCVYVQIIEGLIHRGIPREQIAAIGDADSDAKKQALFEKVRNGQVRVLIGSTAKLGTGTNVQKRLVAMHHLDAPWKPAEVEQRDGRILRQGNTNEEVAIYRYVTEGSFDAFMWQALETKAKFIAQIMTGESGVRRAEDIGGQELSYAEVKAIASGNPAVLTLAEADAELQRLAVLKRNHADEQFIARRKLKELPDHIRNMEKRIDALTTDKQQAATFKGEPVVIGGKAYSIDQSMPALGEALKRIPEISDRRFPIGKYRGLTFGIEYRWENAEVYLTGQSDLRDRLSKESRGPRAVLNALQRIVASYDERIEANQNDLELARNQLGDYQERLGRPFAHTEYLAQLTSLRDRLKMALSETPAEGEPTSAELAEKIKDLKAAQKIEAAPVRVRDKPKAQVVRRRIEPVKAQEIPQPEESMIEDEMPSDDRVGEAVSYRQVVKPKKGIQGRLF